MQYITEQEWWRYEQPRAVLFSLPGFRNTTPLLDSSATRASNEPQDGPENGEGVIAEAVGQATGKATVSADLTTG